MLTELIDRAAELMREQAAAYARLDSLCNQLVAALVRGAPETVESLTRAGESEMLKMRARLVQITATLTSFAEARAKSPDTGSISNEVRSKFEIASQELLQAARKFQVNQSRAAALAANGASFVTACIETCGVPPTTYRAPYARRGDNRLWA
jgi:hypothetical protein